MTDDTFHTSSSLEGDEAAGASINVVNFVPQAADAAAGGSISLAKAHPRVREDSKNFEDMDKQLSCWLAQESSGMFGPLRPLPGWGAPGIGRSGIGHMGSSPGQLPARPMSDAPRGLHQPSRTDTLSAAELARAEALQTRHEREDEAIARALQSQEDEELAQALDANQQQPHQQRPLQSRQAEEVQSGSRAWTSLSAPQLSAVQQHASQGVSAIHDAVQGIVSWAGSSRAPVSLPRPSFYSQDVQRLPHPRGAPPDPRQSQGAMEDEVLASQLQSEADLELAMQEARRWEAERTASGLPVSGDGDGAAGMNDEALAWSLLEEDDEGISSRSQSAPRSGHREQARLRAQERSSQRREQQREQQFEQQLRHREEIANQREQLRRGSPSSGAEADDFYTRLWGVRRSSEAASSSVHPQRFLQQQRPAPARPPGQLPLPRPQPSAGRGQAAGAGRGFGGRGPVPGRRNRLARPYSQESSSEDEAPLRRVLRQSASAPTGFAVPGARREAVNSSTVVVPFRAEAEGGTSEENKACTICCENFSEGENLRLLPCLHRYHVACIDRWLTQSRTCPVCKHDITD
eukprot:TRINITY_DN51448_c0_g1_i1.p1 TRINITY_DN51448_c0_g1~~TRINITY_DN51448_c0_g1_i1.p1  ORF type:complete len:576 (+),score=137.38 TRINITY_DN51448_c0_g1_i1:56-1783(+)